MTETAITGFPWAINQEVPEGYGYDAAALRAQHYDATSGGNGVGSPTALKVSSQTAPDGTILVLPGSATLVSPYDGHEGQSYHAFFSKPNTKTVSPTGSSAGGRTDLVIVQVCDPDHDNHWDYSGTYPIPPAVAAKMLFKRIHVLEGQDRSANLPYPHAKLAEIVRPPNSTIVDESLGHIVPLRELANPKTDLHFRVNNMTSDETQSLHSTSTVWPTDATHMVRIPEFAARVQIWGEWASVLAVASARAQGTVAIALVHPDGSEIVTQVSRWRNNRTDGESETLNIKVGDSRPVPAKFRGRTVRVEMRGTKLSGPNVYMDGNSSWSVQLYFEQEIA